MVRAAVYDRFGRIEWWGSYEEGIDPSKLLGSHIWEHAQNSDVVQQHFMLALLDYDRHECVFVTPIGQLFYVAFQQTASGVVTGIWWPSKNSSVYLTQRQQQVLCLVAADLTNKEIAHQLDIKLGTVESHRAAVRKKIGANGTAGETRWAIEHGLA